MPVYIALFLTWSVIFVIQMTAAILKMQMTH